MHHDGQRDKSEIKDRSKMLDKTIEKPPFCKKSKCLYGKPVSDGTNTGRHKMPSVTPKDRDMSAPGY
jgi:hypothetical protein